MVNTVIVVMTNTGIGSYSVIKGAMLCIKRMNMCNAHSTRMTNLRSSGARAWRTVLLSTWPSPIAHSIRNIRSCIAGETGVAAR
jgi:hypothetical protein